MDSCVDGEFGCRLVGGGVCVCGVGVGILGGGGGVI